MQVPMWVCVGVCVTVCVRERERDEQLNESDGVSEWVGLLIGLLGTGAAGRAGLLHLPIIPCFMAAAQTTELQLPLSLCGCPGNEACSKYYLHPAFLLQREERRLSHFFLLPLPPSSSFASSKPQAAAEASCRWAFSVVSGWSSAWAHVRPPSLMSHMTENSLISNHKWLDIDSGSKLMVSHVENIFRRTWQNTPVVWKFRLFFSSSSSGVWCHQISA